MAVCESSTSSINLLPDEIITIILSCVDLLQLVDCTKVCKRWAMLLEKKKEKTCKIYYTRYADYDQDWIIFDYIAHEAEANHNTRYI